MFPLKKINPIETGMELIKSIKIIQKDAFIAFHLIVVSKLGFIYLILLAFGQRLDVSARVDPRLLPQQRLIKRLFES